MRACQNAVSRGMAYWEGQRGQCENCGAVARAVLGYCGKCGQMVRPPAPKNYLLESMLATTLCWPIAGFSIYHAVKVDDLYERGDYEGAGRESALAKKYFVMSVLAGLAVFVIAIVSLLIWAIVANQDPPDEFLMT